MESSAYTQHSTALTPCQPIVPCLPCCRSKDKTRVEEEALCLDMGQYSLPAGINVAATAAAAATNGRRPDSQQSSPKGGAGDGHGHFLHLPVFGGLWNRSSGTSSFRGQDTSSPDKLRVLQLLAPALVGRAKVFGNQLALRADMSCEDMPYFDGPGTMHAPLGPERLASIMMPEVSGKLQRCSVGATLMATVY